MLNSSKSERTSIGKLVKNWGNLVFSLTISTVVSFLCFAVLGKKMTVDDYGLFNTMIALATTTAAFVNNVLAGIIANREIAIHPESSRSIFTKFLLVRTVAYAIAILVLYIYTRQDSRVTSLIFVSLVVLLAADSFWELFEQISLGMKITKNTMLINISSTLVWFLVVLLLPKEKVAIEYVLPAFAAINLLKILAYGAIDLSLTAPYRGVSAHLSYRALLGASIPYLYIRVLGTISTQIPILLLDGYASLSEAAYYAVGEKFTTPVTKLTMVTISAVFPFLTKALIDNRAAATKILNLSFRLILSYGACLALLLCATSDLWLVAILGEKYSSAVEAFNYQIWFAIIVSVDTLFSMTLSSDFKQKTLAIITTIDAGVLLPFLYVGMQSGAKGVAMAKLIAAVACLLYHLIIMAKYFSQGIIHSKLLLPWLFFFAMILTSILVHSRLVLLVIATAAFITCTILNKTSLMYFFHLVIKKKTKSLQGGGE